MPAPFGPSSPNTSPLRTSNEMPRTASTPLGYVFVNALTTTGSTIAITSHVYLFFARISYQISFRYYDASMKTYGQRCPLARALDIVGERWTLLVVRELMLGPRRYTDLTDGLPGVGTNILAARLADLQSAGLVTKRELPPPTAVTVYDLTEAGRALGPSLGALTEWGERYGAPVTDSQAVRPQWILTRMARRNADLLAGQSCELRVGRDVFELSGDGSKLSITTGTARTPDAAIALEPDVFYALATKRLTARKAREHAVIDGDRAAGAQVLAAISGAAAGYAGGPDDRGGDQATRPRPTGASRR